MSNTFHQNLAQTTPYPFGIKVDHAKGSYLYDKDGNSYIDLISGIGVSVLGHGNQAVINAIKNQVDKHLHVMVYGEFEQDAQNSLAEELKRTLPSQLHSFYFLNSGTEANEAAMKLAKRVTGRSKFISFKGSYHGNSQGSMSISDNEWRKMPFRPLIPGVSFIRLNHEEDLSAITKEVAGVFLETIQGDAGVRIPEKSFMKALRGRCNEVGALLIFDEIQSGVGRTGKMWAFEHFDVVPDIMTAGKALGGGMPIGCMASSKENMLLLSHQPILGHITTFGGHPVVCAAGAAALKYIREENLLAASKDKAALFMKLLKHPKIKAIRQIGLMFAIELESEEVVKQVVLEGLKKGLLLFWFLSTPYAFRLAPPLTISEDEIKTALKILLELIDQTK